MILGALEAGGTKMVCAIGNESGEILEQVSIPTERLRYQNCWISFAGSRLRRWALDASAPLTWTGILKPTVTSRQHQSWRGRITIS